MLYRRARREDTAVDPEPVVPGMKGQTRGMGRRNNMYRLTDELYDTFKARHMDLRAECERATRLLGRAASTKMGRLDGKSAVRLIINHLQPPSKEYVESARSCELMRYGAIGSFEEFDVCWSAHQRALWLMSAYMDFVGDLLPEGFAPSVTKRAALTPKSLRRGIILAGKDLKLFFRFFRRLGIPLWAWVQLSEFDVPAHKFGPADPPRAIVEDCLFLSKFLFSFF